MKTEKEYEYWLASLHGISSAKKRLLKEIFHSARAVFNIEETARTSCWFLTETEKETLKAQQKEAILDDKCRAWERARKQGICLTCWGDLDYPEKLSGSPSPLTLSLVQGRTVFHFQR